MRNLILLTASFPYEGGEQFLETEIQYWKDTAFDNVYILPSTSNGSLRDYPPEIKVLAGKKKKNKSIYVLRAILDKYFYKELAYIVKSTNRKHWLGNILTALKAAARLAMEKDNISSALKPLKRDKNTAYSYWNDATFYASCLLKEEGLVSNIVSRAHGGDLYEERKKNNYMPLKRQFSNSDSYIYFLSESAVQYYREQYNTKPEKLSIARLGVKLPAQILDCKTVQGELRILSISYCVPVKQIHLIQKALSEYATENKDITIVWKHIGGGPLYETLKMASEKVMSTQSNLKISFIGQLANTEVKKKLAAECFDVFINSSASEGIPVSIMEAMSYKIPAIAPDVGGIADLVNRSNGYLMPAVCTTDDIKKGIDAIHQNKEKINYKENAYQWVKKNFNSDINYPEFIEELERIAKKIIK